MKPSHYVALTSLSLAASTLQGEEPKSFQGGVYTDPGYASVFKFEKGRFQHWANIGPPIAKPSLKSLGIGTYSVAGNEITLKYESGEKTKWMFRMYKGKPSLWDVGADAFLQNLGKAPDSGVLYWTKSSPEQIPKDHPNIHE